MSYEVLVTDRAGVPYREITQNCNVARIVEELNGPGLAELTMSTTEAATLDTVGPNGSYRWKRYLQIWRISNAGKSIRFFGPIVSASLDGPRTTVTAFGALAILTLGKRFLGPAPSVDAFSYQTAQPVPGASVYRDFPTSLTGWTATSCTQARSNEIRAEGIYSLKVVNTGGAGADAFTEYAFDYTVEAANAGASVPLFIKGWAFAAALSAATSERGLYVRSEYPVGTIVDEQFAAISANFPTMGNFRLETVVKAAGGVSPQTNRIFIRVYAAGTVYWDSVNVFRDYTVGAAVFPSGLPEIIDYGTVISRVIDYAAGRTAAYRAIGKSDLGWDVSVPPCGVTGYRNYYLGTNQNIWDLLDNDYIKTGLYDFATIPKADGTGWTFTGWTPRRGVARSTLALEFGGNVVGSPRYDCDGTKATNKARVLGRGTGSSREVVEVFDSSVFDGLTLESVETMAADAELSALKSRADSLFAAGAQAGQVPEVQTKQGVGADILDAGVTVGDSIPLIINYGWVQESASRRIVKLTELPNDVLAFATNNA